MNISIYHKTFLEVFNKIDLSKNIVYEFKKAFVKKINVNKVTNSMIIYLELYEIIDEEYIFKLYKILKKEFPFINIDIDLKYSLKNYSLEDKIKKYWNNILYLVKKKSILCFKILKNSKWMLDQENLIVEVDNNSAFLFNNLNFSEFIEDCIKTRFSFKLNVIFKNLKDNKNSKEECFKLLTKKEKIILNDTTCNYSENINTYSNNKNLKQNKFKVINRNYAKINNNIFGDFIKLEKNLEIDESIIFEGKIFDINIKETKNDMYLISFDVTDKTDSITVKFFIPIECYTDSYKNIIKKENYVIVKGKVKFDKFSKELNIIAMEIGLSKNKKEKIFRHDLNEKKRVELHLHTQMSSMDGITCIKNYVERAKEWGHKAIALTDHGVLQAFPEAMEAAKDRDIKIIYGLEAYLVDDLGAVVQCSKNQNLDEEYVIFDIETTGLYKEVDLIIEIGAVKIKNGIIIDTFSSFIDPQKKLSKKIIELTNITDDMLKGQPSEKYVIEKFLNFIGDSVLVAHNANFDVGFIVNAVYKNFKKELENTILDTLELSRALFPELSRHKLNVVAEHLGVKLKNHHRAIDDAIATAEIFIKCIKILKNKKIYNLEDLNKFVGKFIDKSKLKTFHAVILAKNYIGLRNLYELVSDSHIKYFYRKPRIPKSEILRLREGLIVGTACNKGELFEAIINNRSNDFIRNIVDFYDYLEIQPIENNKFMIEKGIVNSLDEIIEINKKIIELGEKYNKIVVATGDVHFLDPEDDIYRKVIMNQEGFKDADFQPPLYYKTTEEMLKNFSYLGETKANEVVIENTNKISDMIEYIKPIPDETFTPKIEEAEDQLKTITINKAKYLYGEELPNVVAERLEKELNSIIKNGFAVMYIIAQKLVWKSLEDGYLVGSRGSVGSSFVATMAGITEVNPLSAHYICHNCKFSDFDSEVVKDFLKNNYGGSGYDMPDRLCPICNTNLSKDGHDIPFETFLGFDGDKEPDIDLNFSGEYQNKAHAYAEELFGKNHVFKAGTIGTVADKTAYCYVKKYIEDKNLIVRNAEINRIKHGCTGIKRTTGQHPGGLIIVPNDRSIYEFSPIQRPANDMRSNVITTHFDYHSISGRLLKLDILGHDVPTIIRILQDTTGVDPKKIDLGDKKIISLFTSTKELGITSDDIDCKTGTLGLPEFGTNFVRKMLVDTKPSSFGELVRISGLSHGTDVWFNNAQDLIKNKICTLKEVIPTRDDIMVYLIRNGVKKHIAFKIMESVRKGNGLTTEYEKIMIENNIPNWYINSCKKIKYMFPKGHAVAYVMMTVRIGYFKIYYPYSFYAAIFSVKSEDFDYELMCRGREKVKEEINRIRKLGNDITTKEKNILINLELVNEMYARNLKFLPLNMYEADAKKFKVYDDGIMPPLSSIQGLGDTVAKNIVESRKNGKFITIEEFKDRTKTTKTVVELLKKNNILDNIPETNQLSLF